jgi:hypothetical protein
MDTSTINNIVIFGGLIIGAAALYLQYKQLNKKSFSYSISDTPIISIKEKLDDVAVTYKGRPVENLRVVIVDVWNSGNKDILEEDFRVPLSFCATQTARGNSLVVAQVIDEPEGAQAEIIIHRIGHHTYRTALKPMLFNPGDRVVVKIIIADYGGENLDVNINGRIAGVKAFKREPYVAGGFFRQLYRELFIPQNQGKSVVK